VRRFLAASGCAIAFGLLGGCASVAPPVAPEAAAQIKANPWSVASSRTPAAQAWQHYALPGKQSTQFHYARTEGRDAMVATANSSASMLRKAVRIEPTELGNVRFSWKVPDLIAQADMAMRDSDDSPVRVVLAFEGDRTKFTPKNAMLSELAQVLTGEPMPYATLMYVWCNRREPGSVIVNPRTDRIRKLVVESGRSHLNQWMDYERDVRADYEKVFGEAPGALIGIAIMTDSDNTRSQAKAWYGPIRLQAASALTSR
jgi:Protein of unknown function (DUF3047)